MRTLAKIKETKDKPGKDNLHGSACGGGEGAADGGIYKV